MFKFRTAAFGLVLIVGTAGQIWAADPAAGNAVTGLFKPAFGAEFEIYAGGITGQSVGSAFKSVTQGDYGLRFTFQVLKSLGFSANYMYSNQTRTLTETLPPVGGLPTRTIVASVRAANLNMVFGNGEFDFVHTKHGVLYISPGVGFARNGSRNLSFITPGGEASFPIEAGTDVTFNLGVGAKIYPRKHWGVRLDVRDFVSGGGTGNISPHLPGSALCADQVPLCNNPSQFLGNIPVNNNLVFTVGLIFRLL